MGKMKVREQMKRTVGVLCCAMTMGSHSVSIGEVWSCSVL